MAESPSPQPEDLADGQVLLRLIAGGLCGSDLPHFRGFGAAFGREEVPYDSSPAGFPLHEVVGEVLVSRSDQLDVGAKVVGWAEGSYGLAEFVVADDNGLVPIDDSMDATRAVMIQPLACVIEAVNRLRHIEGRSAAVLGLGPIGVLFSHVLNSRGVGSVTGIDVLDRTDVAPFFGIHCPVQIATSRWAENFAADDRPDLVIEAIGHQAGTFADAINAVRYQGEVYYFGIPSNDIYPLDMSKFLRKQLTLSAGATVDRRRHLLEAQAYLADNPELARRYVTDIFPVSDAQGAFERAANPRRGQLKVTLDMLQAP